ncbi:glycosyltransferase [Paenibacillus alkalitolerans]|uniref:glycosyltransferase n=1 Tax=Paenibacillus alkalitolerans TaxID=2799335 RepID=UPI0018F78559|nr:glycosyltransferase family 2 protein [Paenibacillus alkalitolerans]
MLLIYAGILLILWAIIFLRAYFGLRSLPVLPHGEPLSDKLPLVSVIIAAKEEQETIGETVRNLLNQTYPRIEIIAVNDRSKDATGAKLEALKAWSTGKERSAIPLKVIHITHLPERWLGKNHALYQAYLQSSGSLLLFTDADIRFHADAIRDSVAYATREGADHVTLCPKLISGPFWLRVFVHYFLFSLIMLLSPWTANRDDRKRNGMGVGAFNLIKRSAYETIGTHKALSMRPDDDLRLGVLVKRHGLRQRVAIGKKSITVEWYTSLRDAVKGLEKNIYAGFGYRLGYAAAGVSGQLLLFAAPFILLPFAGGLAFIVLLAVAGIIVSTYVLCTRRMNDEPGWEGLLLPGAAVMLVVVMVRSIWFAHRRAGVYWRGTFYSLNDLRRFFQ